MKLSIIVPAFNEERYIYRTIAAIKASCEELSSFSEIAVNLILSDNACTDSTPKIAAENGMRIVEVHDRGISQARNGGAAVADGDVLVFVDADTIVPRELLRGIIEEMSDSSCIGGAIDTRFRPQSLIVAAYLKVWRAVAWATQMAQGATQFVRRDAFLALGGYDEKIFMGEDVEFYWRLAKFARRSGQRTTIIRDIRVEPSCRRFDGRSLARIIAETNPLVAILFRANRSYWTAWYHSPPR